MPSASGKSGKVRHYVYHVGATYAQCGVPILRGSKDTQENTDAKPLCDRCAKSLKADIDHDAKFARTRIAQIQENIDAQYAKYDEWVEGL